MGITEFATSAAAVIGFVLLVGGALALVRGSYSKARIQALREDNDDLRARVDDCDRENQKINGRYQALNGKVDHLENENNLLTQLVTQRADVDTVLAELRALHLKAEAHWDRMSIAMERLVDQRGA